MDKNTEIFISSDHGGYELKKELLNQLKDINSLKVVDLGPFELDPDDDYPDYAIKLAESVSAKTNSLGILICRSGNGVMIAANKVIGAYAALTFSKEHAKKAREHDNANIICLDADYRNEDSPLDIVKEFINAEFAGDNTRHGRRFQKIRQYELKK